MKYLKTIISALLFSLLFYQKNVGLNMLLFTILTISVICINDFNKFKKIKTLSNSFAYLITGILIFIYNSNLAIITNICMFFTLIGSVSEHKSSLYIKWLNGIYTTIIAFFHLRYDVINNQKNHIQKKKINYRYWIKIIGIPIIVLIIFISLYRNVNPLFNNLILKIDLSFINLQWILFTFLGYYLFFNITNPIKIQAITLKDINQGNDLKKSDLNYISSSKLKEDKLLSKVLMFSLNILITFFLITYIIHLSEIQSMMAPQLSKQVHNGVNALIISNLLAIAIILYFFRGNLNYFKNNSDLKTLTYVWLALNLSIVIITVLINMKYVISFGYTYKRIGVLFFLINTSVGLITTYIKVAKIKNLWFLIRINLKVAFILLIISSTINWDRFISNYNLHKAEQTDLNYLIKLSNNNTLLLKEFRDHNIINERDKNRIDEKYINYKEYLDKNSWQEKTFDNLILR